jgi:hypothetical protein
MDREDNHKSGEMPLSQFLEPFDFPSSISYNRFGGVRHGFNTGSNRTQPYSHVPNLIPQPYRLLSMRSTPSASDLNNRRQVRSLHTHLKCRIGHLDSYLLKALIHVLKKTLTRSVLAMT